MFRNAGNPSLPDSTRIGEENNNVVPLLALFLAQTQPTVTLSIGASRVPVILEKLSSQTGIQFRSGAQLQDEVLFISVTNAPLNELLSEISHVTHCTWEKNTKGGLDLLRKQGQEASDEYAENILNLAMLRKSPEADHEQRSVPVWSMDEVQENLQRAHELSARISSADGFQPSRQTDLVALRNLNAAQRGVDRLFGAIDPALFADQRPWEYRRYTLNPNQLQYALPSSTADAIEGFRSEEQVALSKFGGVPDNQKPLVARDFGLSGTYMQPLQGPVLALVTSQISGPFIRWEIDFCDSAGNIIDSGSKGAQLHSEADLSALPGLEEWGKAAVNFPPYLAAQDRQPLARELKPEERKILNSPLEHDPLGLLCDNGLARLGAEVHKDIVAALPDECAWTVPSPKDSLTNFCRDLARSVTFKNEDGRLLISPIRRAEAYAVRAKRAPLQAFLRSLSDDPVPIDLASSYACAQNELAAFSPLERVVLGNNQHWSSIDRVLGSLCNQPEGDRLKLKFYGLLSESQRQRMTKDGIQFRELSADAQGVMREWLYGTRESLQANMSAAERRAFLQQRRQGETINATFLEQDPTFSLAQGIPGSALITLREQKNLAVIDVNSKGLLKVWSCASLGYVASQQERGEMLDPRTGYPMVSKMKVKPAMSRVFYFTVEYLPHLAETFAFAETTAEGSAAVKIQELPSDWLSEVEKSLSEYRKQFKDAASQGPPQQQQTGPPS